MNKGISPTATRWLITTAGLALLTGCGGSDNTVTGNDPGDTDGDLSFSQVVADARTGTAYLNLDRAEFTDEGGDWHIAFNRMNVMVNSGASGSGQVASALAVSQDHFYDSAGEPDPNLFLNATPGSMLEHLVDSFPEPSDWGTDALTSAFGDMYAWSEYDRTTGVINELPDIGYLVRSDTGDSYARMRVAEFSFPTRSDNGIESFTLEFEVQAARTEQFSGTVITFTTPVDYDGGDACFDFDSNQTVTCAADTGWDVQIGFSGREWYLRSNSGQSGSGQGGALGPVAWDELATYTSATTTSDGDSLSRAYVADTTGGTFTEHSWYAYNLQEQHKLWPNYRVYLIDTDSADADAAVYGLQIIGYYGEDGQSGQPVIRWKPATLTSEAE